MTQKARSKGDDIPTTTRTVDWDDLAGWAILIRFSREHLLTASFFTKQCALLEKEYLDSVDKLEHESIQSPATQPNYEGHLAYVIGTLLTSVCFLESFINEVLFDLSGKESGIFLTDMKRKQREDIVAANLWELLGDRKSISIVDKYQLTLMVAGKKPFEKGEPPLQDIELIIGLRNELVHFKPEWFVAKDEGIKRIHKWEKKLRAKKIRFNPKFENTEIFFPYKMFGYGLAKWIVETCIKFSDEFLLRMGLNPTFPPYNEIRSTIDANINEYS